MPHDSDRWRQIKQLFGDALELPPVDRARLLKAACGADDALRGEVQSLLDAHLAGGPMDRLHNQLNDLLHHTTPEPGMSGRTVGPYEVLQQLGEGGMGRVLLAKRADGQFDQRVALKLLRADLATGDAHRRFLAERQILAGLSHPNIARLVDGGIDPEGRPFFAMEYVEGEPLDVYCTRRGLSIDERIELFLSVCDAVQYAHRSLIVHRDLKPSNILVSSAGTVKLLDFGVAKLIDSSATQAAFATRTGLLPLTPAYASPEQLQNEAITTATDVYQLGAVLYELVAGVPPFDVRGCSPAEVEALVCLTEARPPSTARLRDPKDAVAHGAEARQANQGRRSSTARTARIRGDLDTIVLKALRKAPDQRYLSVEQLADDLRRYLTRRPIRARPQTWRYRAGTFVRRHRWGVGVSALIALMVAGYIVTITWHSRETQRALARAEEEAVRAENVSQFLVELFEAGNPATARGDTLNAYDLLEQGVERADRLSATPAVQADLYETMAQVYAGLGNFSQAEMLMREALKIRTELNGEWDEGRMGTLVRLASMIQQAGKYRESVELLDGFLQSRARRPSSTDALTAGALTALGAALRAEGNLERAERVLREALEAQHTLHGEDHPDVGKTLNLLGLLLIDRNDAESAERMLRRAIDVQRRVLGEAHPELAMSVNNLAMLLRQRGDSEAAEPVYREALAIKRQIYGAEHPSTASTLNGLGLLMQDRGLYEDAERYLRQALNMRQATLGAHHPVVAGSLNNLGNVLENQGRLDEAIPLLEEARARFAAALGPDHPYVAYPSIGLGRIHLKQERPQEAEPLLREAMALREAMYEPDHPEVEEVRRLLNAVAGMNDQSPEAEGFQEAHADRR